MQKGIIWTLKCAAAPRTGFCPPTADLAQSAHRRYINPPLAVLSVATFDTRRTLSIMCTYAWLLIAISDSGVRKSALPILPVIMTRLLPVLIMFRSKLESGLRRSVSGANHLHTCSKWCAKLQGCVNLSSYILLPLLGRRQWRPQPALTSCDAMQKSATSCQICLRRQVAQNNVILGLFLNLSYLAYAAPEVAAATLQTRSDASQLQAEAHYEQTLHPPS